MDESLPINATTTEDISSVNQINNCISADPLETGMCNKVLYTVISPAFSINTHLLPIWGKERPFFGVAEVVSNFKFPINFFARGFD